MDHARCGGKGQDRDGRAHGLGYNVDGADAQSKKTKEKDSAKEEA